MKQALLSLKFQVIFCGCKVLFVSDLVGNPEDRFSCNTAHILILFDTFEVFNRVTLFRSLAFF